MVKSNLQKYETYIRNTDKTSEDCFNLLSLIPGAGLFFGLDWLSPAVGESDNSNHTAGCTLLEDQPYYYTDSFRYTDINICMWHSDWFYSIS